MSAESRAAYRADLVHDGREAERANAELEQACRDRCPVACALQAEAYELIQRVPWSFTPGTPWCLLADADSECQRAKEAGVDLTGERMRAIAQVCQDERDRDKSADKAGDRA